MLITGDGTCGGAAAPELRAALIPEFSAFWDAGSIN
jgi:hypothetical protein